VATTDASISPVDDGSLYRVAAYRRSLGSQPPLDNANLGGGSNVPYHEATVVQLAMDPVERVTPRNLALPEHLFPQTFHAAVSSIALEAIAALASLVDEVNELDNLVQDKYLPSLALFGSHLKLKSCMPDSHHH